MRRVLWALLAVFVVAGHAQAANPMLDMPPEIQAILAKMKAGTLPTPDDLAKLQAWQQGVTSRVNAPVASAPAAIPPAAGGAAAAPNAIPCRVSVELDYTISSPGSTQTGHLTGYTDAQLYAQLGGDGDYAQSLLNPAAAFSSFRFMPIMPAAGATQRPAIGGGSARMHMSTPASRWSRNIEGTLSHVAFGVMLTTTGHDALWASGAGLFGQLDGTAATTDPSGTQSSAVHSDDGVTEVLGGLAPPFVDEQRHSLQGGQPTPAPTMNLSYRQLAAAVRSGRPATVGATESFHFTKDGATVSGTSSITISLRPRPLQLIIEPSNEKAFEKWEPMPDDSDEGAKPEYFGHPGPLAIHVVLHDPAKAPTTVAGPTKPSADVGGQIDVRLKEVSTYPGMAMDYPAKRAANTKPDLFFPKNMQVPGVVWDDESHVHSASQNAVEITVWVAARDTAAYGKVEASIDTLGLTSYSPRSKSSTLTVPLDDNDNHIADAWEKSENIYERKLPPDWDDEDLPAGMAKNGDGLTLMDEYRGFVFAEEGGQPVFHRLSPKTRKLFVMPNGVDHALYHQGAVKYGEITGITVLFTRPEFAEPWPEGGLHLHRWINFNATQWSRPASAVRIEDKDVSADAPGTTHYMDKSAAIAKGGSETVPQTDWINISRAQSGKLVRDIYTAMNNPTRHDVQDAARNAHIDMAAVKSYADPLHQPSEFAHLVNGLIEFMTVHELGHATGASHHALKDSLNAPESVEWLYSSGGAANCPMRYWHQEQDPTNKLLWLTGRWDPSANAPGGRPWAFCATVDDDWGHMRLK